eukprot:s401_g26.t1
MHPTTHERAPLFQRIFPFFACFAAAARNRKALLFEPPQGAGPPPVEVEKLPLKVALNLQRQLQRQAAEGALAYSGTALETAKKQIMYRSMMRHTISLRRECDLFNSLFLESRLLSDQLHIALTQCCEAYVKARILDENLLKSLETPEEVPQGGHVYVRWSPPDLRATAEASEASESKPAPTALCTSLLVFLCPLGEEEPRPLLARSLVHLAALQKRADVLSTDLEHCRPATAVSASYVEQELREPLVVVLPAATGRGARTPTAWGATEKWGGPICCALVVQSLQSRRRLCRSRVSSCAEPIRVVAVSDTHGFHRRLQVEVLPGTFQTF